ncbi:MAG: hypothetical protein U5R49_01125 [Deltaproteobacteria bacterium]|nr:hypothetical protein [Deltaproteobacteria bacterium]
MSRGNDGQDIFYGDGDKRLFLSTIGEMADRFGPTPNHPTNQETKCKRFKGEIEKGFGGAAFYRLREGKICATGVSCSLSACDP